MSSSSGKSSEVKARYANMDEKKRKRMQSNRESARRSRMRREQRVKDLVNEIGRLKDQILQFNRQYNDLRERAHALLLENEGLSIEKMGLAEYLNNLYSVHARFAQMQMGCFGWNQPWQVHSQFQPIVSTGTSKD